MINQNTNQMKFYLNVLVVLLFTGVSANAVNCTWIGSTTGNWGTAANWSCGHVPLQTDDVVISEALVTLNVSPVVNNLNVTRITSTVGYVVDGPGSLTVYGTFNMMGDMNNSGGVTISTYLNMEQFHSSVYVVMVKTATGFNTAKILKRK